MVDLFEVGNDLSFEVVSQFLHPRLVLGLLLRRNFFVLVQGPLQLCLKVLAVQTQLLVGAFASCELVLGFFGGC